MNGSVRKTSQRPTGKGKTGTAPGGLKFIPDCKLSRLKVYDRNPRQNDPAVEAVSKSITTFGFISPVIIDQKYHICAGHTRYKAATRLGLETIPVIMVPSLEGDRFTGFNIADNRTGQIAGWDQDELSRIVQELKDHEFDLSALGFNENELKDLLAALDGPDFDPASIEDQGRLDRRTPVKCPECGHEFTVEG